MSLKANESNIPRLHLLATLAVVLIMTVSLIAFFSWQRHAEQQATLARVEHTIVQQKAARLSAEMDTVLGYLDFMHSRTEDVLRANAAAQVDSAMQMIEALYARESGRRSAHEVQQLILAALRPMRFFDGRGYFFVDDTQGRFVLLPTAPQFEGKDGINNQDDTGHYIMRGLIDAARKPRGEGYSRYRWYRPDTPNTMADKVAYVRHFAPYDWLVGTGDYSYEWAERQKREAIARLRGVRFGVSGYIGLLSLDGRSILSPALPEVEGLHTRDMALSQRNTLEAILDKAREGGGLIHYNWPHPQTGHPSTKAAYVKIFEPWGWVVVASIYQDETEAAIAAEIQSQHDNDLRRTMLLGLVVLFTLGLGVAASFGFSHWSRRVFQDYHDEREAHAEALRQGEQRLALVIKATGDAPWDWDLQAQHLYTSDACWQMLGRTRPDDDGDQSGWQKLMHPEDTASMQEIEQALHGDAQSFAVEFRLRHADGHDVPVLCRGFITRNTAGQAVRVTGSNTDLTERQRAEQDLRIAAIAFESQEGMFVTNPQSVILRVNQSFTDITGYSAEDAIGQTPALLSSGRHDAAFYAAMRESIERTGMWRGEIWNRRKNGSTFPEWLTITAVKNAQGVVTHYVSTLTDITQRKAAEDQIKSLAFFDPLTRLPNRRLLLDRLQQAMTTSLRTHQAGALLFIDLDHFKLVNDTLGHDKGDRLLEQVAQRLTQAVRDGDTVARLGGDEFVVMLENLGTNTAEAAGHAELVGEKILKLLARPYTLGDHEVTSSGSVGVALFANQDDTPEELMKRADAAMYQAKEAGRHAVRFFDPDMHLAVMKRVSLESALRQSLRDGDFRLVYQAQVGPGHRLLGAEALVRWHHPELGVVSPAEFIPLAEDTGLILPLGEWVLTQACFQLARWAAEPGREHLSLAVNVSGRQLRQADFVQQVLDTLQRTGAPAQRLKLEITESLLLDNKDDSCRKMAELQAQGVGFSLDDFGTGYSSLAYLKQLPLDQLKIDQSFVRDLPHEAKDAAIVRTIVALASSLGLKVIAEGVETEAQRQALAEHGCPNCQGYLYGRPGPVDTLPYTLA